MVCADPRPGKHCYIKPLQKQRFSKIVLYLIHLFVFHDMIRNQSVSVETARAFWPFLGFILERVHGKRREIRWREMMDSGPLQKGLCAALQTMFVDCSHNKACVTTMQGWSFFTDCLGDLLEGDEVNLTQVWPFMLPGPQLHPPSTTKMVTSICGSVNTTSHRC